MTLATQKQNPPVKVLGHTFPQIVAKAKRLKQQAFFVPAVMLGDAHVWMVRHGGTLTNHKGRLLYQFAKRNPIDPLRLLGGIASVLQIEDMVHKRQTRKKKPSAVSRQRSVKKRNPAVAAKRSAVNPQGRTPAWAPYEISTPSGRSQTHTGLKAAKEQARAMSLDRNQRVTIRRVWDGKIVGTVKASAKDVAAFARSTQGRTSWTNATRARTQNPRSAKKPDAKAVHYLLTIGTDDDLMAVYLHDGKRDGFDKKFKTLQGAKVFARRHKLKVVENPRPVTLKRNVPGFVDDLGIFHPIRSGDGYSPISAGDRKTAPRRRMDAKRNLIAAAKKTADKRTRHKIVSQLATKHDLTRKQAERMIGAAPRKANGSGTKQRQQAETAIRNPHSSARRRTYEMFQGRRVDRFDSVPASRLAPKDMDQLGDLVELKVNGNVIKLPHGRYRLCASGGKLWIVGGKVARPDASVGPREINPIGTLEHVVYGTEKPHHGDHRRTHYIHTLGEETGHVPTLCADRDGFAVIRGGAYKIEARGIVN